MKTRIAYLVSRYPAISHTFILREVLALRAKGFEIHPVSINPPDRKAEALTAEERDEAARTLYVKNAGAGAVLLGADCCDPLYRKSIRVSVGAALTMPFARFAPDDDPIAVLRQAGFEPIALSPSGRERLSDLKPPARAAVLLGAEGPGLPAELMDRARTVSIPMSAGWDSLNVAVAGGIVLHHLTFG